MKKKCRFCGRILSTAGGLSVHEKSCQSNPNRVKRHSRTAWNKGRTAKDSVSLAIAARKVSDTLKKRHANGSIKNHQKGKPRTTEEKQKISEAMKKSGAGGYRQGSGRGKKGWYKGLYCDSSWELAFILYCFDYGIPVERCTETREYEYEGNTHNYLPDFLVEGYLIEIKGYKTKQWIAKLSCNPDIIVYYEKEMRVFINYAILVYGKDYINLYEKK